MDRRVCTARLFWALVMCLVVSPAWSRIGDIPKAWSVVNGNWITYSYNGSAVRDPINSGGGSGSDPSVGASPNNPVDIASGVWSRTGNKYDTCNPVTTSGECGSEASAFYYYDSNGTPTNSADDTLFLRMRVQQNPTDSDTKPKDFQNFHWNFLISYLPDTPNPAYPSGPTEYKEFWLDLAGGSASNLSGGVSALRVIYENNDSNTLTTDAFGANGTGSACPRPISTSNGTIVDSFIACILNPLSLNPPLSDECGDAANLAHSFTRVVAVGDGTNQYYIDIQVPVTSLTDNCGTYVVPTSTSSTDTRVPGNQVVYNNTTLQYAYSTSNSNQDPLQKDFIGYGGCGNNNGTTCKVTFGDPKTTPVALSSFRASPQGAGVAFEWSTATEVGNLGFNLYAEVDGARTQINAALIPSKVVNSLTRQTYSYTGGSVAGDVFWIEEVAINHKTQSYGPFTLGESYGDNSLPDPIPWNNIRAQHASAHAQTQQQRLTAWKRYDYPWVNFRVTQKGIYRVTYEDLVAAGVNLAGVPENKLALVNRDQPAPIYVSAKGTFGPGSWIEFYGEPSTSLYTDVNVYQLQVDGSKALRLGDDPKPPRKNETPEAFYMETTTWDENREYAFYSPTDDPWYNVKLFAPTSKTITLSVDDYVPNQGTVMLGVNLWGGIGYRHHLNISLNGTPLGSASFKDIEAHAAQVSVPANVLRQGNNQLTLSLPGDTGDPLDIVDVDRYSLTYPRAFVAKNDLLPFASAGKQFQISGLSSPSVVVHRQESNGQWVRLREIAVSSGNPPYTASFAGTGQPARYVVAGATRKPGIEVASADLTLASDRAQLLIIAHPDFIPGLQSLVERRQGKYQVKVADVDAVYDQFGAGAVDPTAIQRYIRYAVENLGTQYVLLVGGDSYDYKNYLGLGSMSFIPSLYAATDELVRHTPVDPLLADVNGDSVPDVPIGRLPVRTVAELQTLLTKIGQYESKFYTQTAVLAADKDFGADAESFATVLDDWSVERAYLDQMTAAQAKAQIKASVNAGSALVGFVGHSGPTLWTYKGLFDIYDVLSLGNAGKPTLVSQWGCWNTYYVDPINNSMAQSFLVAGAQGAAAVLGATTLTQDSTERMLGTALTPLLAQPGMTIGDALQQAKRQVAAQNSSARDILLGWTILGDPTQVVTP